MIERVTSRKITLSSTEDFVVLTKVECIEQGEDASPNPAVTVADQYESVVLVSAPEVTTVLLSDKGNVQIDCAEGGEATTVYVGQGSRAMLGWCSYHYNGTCWVRGEGQ